MYHKANMSTYCKLIALLIIATPAISTCPCTSGADLCPLGVKNTSNWKQDDPSLEASCLIANKTLYCMGNSEYDNVGTKPSWGAQANYTEITVPDVPIRVQMRQHQTCTMFQNHQIKCIGFNQKYDLGIIGMQGNATKGLYSRVGYAHVGCTDDVCKYQEENFFCRKWGCVAVPQIDKQSIAMWGKPEVKQYFKDEPQEYTNAKTFNTTIERVFIVSHGVFVLRADGVLDHTCQKVWLHPNNVEYQKACRDECNEKWCTIDTNGKVPRKVVSITPYLDCMQFQDLTWDCLGYNDGKLLDSTKKGESVFRDTDETIIPNDQMHFMAEMYSSTEFMFVTKNGYVHIGDLTKVRSKVTVQKTSITGWQPGWQVIHAYSAKEKKKAVIVKTGENVYRHIFIDSPTSPAVKYPWYANANEIFFFENIDDEFFPNPEYPVSKCSNNSLTTTPIITSSTVDTTTYTTTSTIESTTMSTIESTTTSTTTIAIAKTPPPPPQTDEFSTLDSAAPLITNACLLLFIPMTLYNILL